MVKCRAAAISALTVALLVGLLATDQPQATAAENRTGGLSFHWNPVLGKTNHVVVELSGLSASALQELNRADLNAAQWSQLFSVYASQGDLMSDLRIPPMIGRHLIESNLLRFEPQFPLQPGVRYRAVFRPAKLPGEPVTATGSEPVTSIYDLPLRPANSTTVVTQIYPTADLLPENLLKFYLHFSAPMSRGHIYDHIQLRNETGKPVELPFLEIDEELWDPSLTRLTLFIDPGRIKRGVRPLEEIGPALQAGKRYSLFIDQAWKDANGNHLAKTFKKTFQVGPPDRESLNPQQWRIHEPRPDAADPLEITFPKPLDHALARRLIRVFGPTTGSARSPQRADARSEDSSAPPLVSGEVTLLDHERRWRFTPTRPWSGGRYTLQIETTLEDLAGNNIGKPFEVDLFEGVQRRITNSVVQLSFQIQ